MTNQNFSECKQLITFLTAEKRIIMKHLSDHKWFQHISDENLGVMDFIDKYGWIMREMYCGFACKNRFSCKIAQRFELDNAEPEKTDEDYNDM